ncbi:sugar fermentation stimulation protein A [Monaibacterium marinum]|uniref:Sugar fermentation stimulation protein homolog n=1 Tax=Pontivivens marinum TaxID=1690039 RepID=A0A2C9CN15_9RHOB|nr:DNA/RNA nuclease SfsA [Monaibacterium marinum]SOH92786.1 sugar fermentation stimulation protein A [Monaibacterium marinum]
MLFDPPLIRAILLRRYKRFLADVILPDGREVVVHCANPGRMTGVADAGAAVWLQASINPKRKLQWSWVLTELGGGAFAGIDTSLPNRLVAQALQDGQIAELTQWDTIRPEVPYGTRSRVDFLLSDPDQSDLYLEVKNVNLRRAGTLAEFPDCKTARGAKHLDELIQVVADGHRATMLYVVQRTDCDAVSFAADLDPVYAMKVTQAAQAGVQMIARATRISAHGITLGRALPVILP